MKITVTLECHRSSVICGILIKFCLHTLLIKGGGGGGGGRGVGGGRGAGKGRAA